VSREDRYTLLTKSMGDTIKLETTDDAIYRGLIIKVDDNYLYLCSTRGKGMALGKIRRRIYLSRIHLRYQSFHW